MSSCQSKAFQNIASQGRTHADGQVFFGLGKKNLVERWGLIRRPASGLVDELWPRRIMRLACYLAGPVVVGLTPILLRVWCRRYCGCEEKRSRQSLQQCRSNHRVIEGKRCKLRRNKSLYFGAGIWIELKSKAMSASLTLYSSPSSSSCPVSVINRIDCLPRRITIPNQHPSIDRVLDGHLVIQHP